MTAVVADRRGRIFELDGYAAVGMAGSFRTPLGTGGSIGLPYGSELMFLSERKPVVYNLDSGCIETLAENPCCPGEAVFPVAVFNSPGFVVTYNCAYTECSGRPVQLPLFSYGAVGWHRGRFRSAAVCVDRERRQDLRMMPLKKVRAGIGRMRQRLPGNRLREHLENCALTYGCPAAKNFFLGRYEAPLPSATVCNARCLGCLSLQTGNSVSVCQERIRFTPTAAEIAEVALEHIGRVRDAVASFGQGCEGDPLLAADVIEPAIRSIRSRTEKGTLNMNTNGSRPDILLRLFEAGLDSVRISMNSVRESCYMHYFRPVGYRFADVVASIDLANRMGKFVSINYLNCPGFTDSPEEFDALLAFLKNHPVQMIQWRNLNFDPLKYLHRMNRASRHGRPVGMTTVLAGIRAAYPDLRFGYFNPPRAAWQNGAPRGRKGYAT